MSAAADAFPFMVLVQSVNSRLFVVILYGSPRCRCEAGDEGRRFPTHVKVQQSGLLAELGWRPTGCAFLNQSCACWCCARISPLASFLRVPTSRPFSLFLTKGIEVPRPNRGQQRWFSKGGMPSTEFEIP